MVGVIVWGSMHRFWNPMIAPIMLKITKAKANLREAVATRTVIVAMEETKT